MKKIVIAVLGLVVVGGGAFYALKVRNKGPQAVEVEAAPLAKMTIVQTVNATGKIQPKTQINISADVSAKITKMEVAEGDWVEKGKLLLELDRERYLAAVEISEANVRVGESNADLARENMIKAEKDLERVLGLFSRKLESQSTLDGSRAAANAEKARHRSMLDQVEQARSALKQSRDDLAKTRIYAPIAGTISKLNKEVGEIALGSQFQEDVIMEISNLGGMEAVVNVDENDIVSIALGDKATIEVDALPGVTLAGEVAEIANSAKQSAAGTTAQKTEFEVKVTINDANNQLRPGMTASSEIVTETKDEVFGVPIQSVAVRTADQLKKEAVKDEAVAALGALEPDKDGFVQFVFVVGDSGRVTAHPVKTGIQSNTHIEIVSGLEDGAKVVTGNYRAISKDLQHGTLVKVQVNQPAAEVVAQR